MDRINVAQIEAGRERWQALNALDAYDIASSLERLKSPVLLIWGDHFRYARFREEFTRRIAGSRVVIVKDGRFCLPWERPEEVGAAVLDFLK
jgi:pimeloyl-ACP methyl ester carboxylesterase